MAQKLEFTTISLSNLVISNETDVIFYEITTPEWEPQLTKIKRQDPRNSLLQVVAELENEGGKPGSVRMLGSETVPLDTFLKVEGGKFHFTNKEGVNYAWQVENGIFQLIRDDAPQTPLAEFYPHQRYMYLFSVTEYPYLMVQPAALEDMDFIIVSFILAEGTRRGSFY
ncbi:hypothetical protein JAAARDRAFT_46402 [Jaapia argillacea MUCL 33604]|uniref:DUF6593 domain-containing protein n=1 Tax=Jaapia argillacea MUCL 33604 TaxID=933084 RepID=A0A067QB07_9AGAM|nr:hypothetical protein JAAARDRAFT_46402 [Jaapia argillacea MUCL 33604]